MKVWYICDEGLAITMDTGSSASLVANMQSAIKFLVKSKDVMACKVQDIEIYALGVTKATYETATPLKPEDNIPEGSTQKNAIFVHVPRDKQQLTPEERRIYANPKPKPMARPQIEKFSVKKKKQKPKPPPPPPEPEQVTVTVRCYDGKEFKAVIDPKHTIADLKNQFGYDSGVSARDQILSKDGGPPFEDAKTAAESGIQNGNVIDLDAKPITVLVRTPDGKRIPVTLKLSDVTEYIKEKVAPESGIEVPRQILKYNGVELPDGKTARQHGLQDGSILDVEPRFITVQVKCPDGNVIPVDMKPTDEILFIKEKVAPVSGIEVPKQLLKFHDKELPNDKTATEMGLQHGSVIDLKFPTITVQVKTPDGKIIPVTMEPSDKIKFIKKKVAPETGIPVKDQTLKYNDTELPNDKTADAMGLQDGSVIDLFGPKDDSSDDESTDIPAHEPKQYKHDFVGTPLDLTRFRAWFMIADTVPFEMICPIAMTVQEFKVEILKLRNDARFVQKYFEGLEDPSLLKIYPAGSWGEGEPLADDIPVPKDSSEYAFFSVMR